MKKALIVLNTQESIKYWAEISDYDLETAEAMLETKRFLYVGFMCHQAAEKMLKAHFVKTQNSTPPFIHSLRRLAEKSGLWEKFDENFIETIHLLEPLNIESRYPSYKERLFQALSTERCREIIDQTKKLTQWIRQQL